MFRALFLAFHGSSRLERAVEDQVSESGHKMTVPLVVLAFFSVVAGYVSLPKAWGGGEWFHYYLQPVFASSEALLSAIAVHPASPHEGALAVMGMSLAVAGAGILLAYLCYLKFTKLPDGLAERFSGLYRVVVHKYYVDEFYHWLVVRPISRGSERFLWRVVDARAIDALMVNGSAELTVGAGGVLRRIQSGNLRSYATWVLLGAVLWLGYVLLR